MCLCEAMIEILSCMGDSLHFEKKLIASWEDSTRETCLRTLPEHWQIYIVKFWTHDPSGRPNFFNFMQFFGEYGKIVCSHPPPPPECSHPHLGEVLDPPLLNAMFTLDQE